MATGNAGSSFSSTVNLGDVPTPQNFADTGASIVDLYRPGSYVPPMPYASFGGGGGFSLAYDKNPFRLKCTGTGDGTQLVYLPIPTRKNQVLTKLDVRIEQISGTATTVKLVAVAGLNGTSTPTESVLQTATGTIVSSDQVLTITPGSPITVGIDTAYYLVWVPGGNGDWLYGARAY